MLAAGIGDWNERRLISDHDTTMDSGVSLPCTQTSSLDG